MGSTGKIILLEGAGLLAVNYFSQNKTVTSAVITKPEDAIKAINGTSPLSFDMSYVQSAGRGKDLYADRFFLTLNLVIQNKTTRKIKIDGATGLSVNVFDENLNDTGVIGDPIPNIDTNLGFPPQKKVTTNINVGFYSKMLLDAIKLDKNLRVCASFKSDGINYSYVSVLDLSTAKASILSSLNKLGLKGIENGVAADQML
jgi:hypothetical protein